jgi:meso-butanediol dehydrogenase/(S,S)-butanediol dehydrogenase/diacetyl reductase
MSRAERTPERAAGEAPAALVTGAAGGIGGAVVAAIAAAGHRVLAVDRQAPRDEVVGPARDEVVGPARNEVVGPARDVVVAHRADLTRDAEAAGAVAAALDRFGRLDVVACCHGGSGRRHGDGPVDECTEGGWDATLELNLKSVFLVCRHAVPALRAGGGGAIVTLASVLGLVGGDRDFATHAYAAAKGAIVSLTRAMAVTYADDGIRCNVVCPGLIATPMSERAQRDPAIRARLGELQPLTGDFGRPEEVAEAVLHLATAPFTTGTVLTVDGGWTAQ